jgi:Ribonuclease G/E
LDDVTKVLLGTVVAGIFGLAGAWIASRRENFKWLRQEKLKAYTDFLVAIEGYLWTLGETRINADSKLDMENFAESAKKIEQARILVLAPSEVYHHADMVINAISDLAAVVAEDLDIEDEDTFMEANNVVRDRRAGFVAAVRKDLKVPVLAAIQTVP